VLLLLRGAVANEHLHVACVRRGAVEDFGSERRGAAHDFAERRVLDVGQPRAVLAVGKKQVPQPGGARLRLEVLDDRHRLPPIAFTDLAPVGAFVGIDVLVHERGEPLLQIFGFRGVVEVHGWMIV